jgi:hypothetical protein
MGMSYRQYTDKENAKRGVAKLKMLPLVVQISLIKK